MVHKVDTTTYLYKLSKRLWKSSNISDLGIPNSFVFFVRWAIYERTGELFTPEHVRISLWLEGHLKPDEIKEIPQWYKAKYQMEDCSFSDLKVKVATRYNLRQAKIKAELEVDNEEVM